MEVVGDAGEPSGCTGIHPEFGVPCLLPVHPNRYTHFTGGQSADGTRWQLFWWHPGASHRDPDGPADRPAFAP